MQENRKRTVSKLNKILTNYSEVLTEDEKIALKDAVEHLSKRRSDKKLLDEAILAIIRVVSRPEILEDIIKFF